MLNQFAHDLGFIKRRVTTDQYQNQVSVIRVGSQVFRMVHHPAAFGQGRATIYAGPGKYVRVMTRIPITDTGVHSCNVGGFHVSWGDGDCLGVTVPSSQEKTRTGRILARVLRSITEDDFDAVILVVLYAIRNQNELWEQKATRAEALSC